jgi:glycosyltransferase involved in cell wall biosynthesis
VGSFYHKRDPRSFLAALASLNVKGSLPESLRVRFVGDCRWYEEVSLEALAKELGVGEIVSFVDRVPHDECQRMIAASDLLLLFAQDQPAQVPNKLYEYLGRRIPILALVDPGGETEAMLLEIGGHYTIPADASASGVESTLATALAGTPEARDHGDGRLAEWSSDRQMGRLYTALEDR